MGVCCCQLQWEEETHPCLLLHRKQLIILVPICAIASWRSCRLLGSRRAALCLTRDILLLTRPHRVCSRMLFAAGVLQTTDIGQLTCCDM